MTKRFAKIARSQTLFCAVGAGHLAGQKGMLRLLKKKGFNVRPVERLTEEQGGKINIG